VEDEHRLLSQALAILFSYRRLPAEVLDGQPAGARHLSEAETSVGRPREEKADFWTSVGGEYKASIDYVVHITIESGTSLKRGPEVRTQTVRTRVDGAPSATMTELHRFGGTVSQPNGDPVAGAWVAVPQLGRWTATDAAGHFRLDRVTRGEHRILVRAVSGEEIEAPVSVPGGHVDLVLRGRGTRRRSKR
jgi:hypothetical protein